MITKNNLKIDRDFSVNTNWKPTCIEAYIENRGIVYVPDDSGETWANIYAMYVPKDKSVCVECNIHTDYSCSEPLTLEITDEEKELIISELERICMEEEGKSCAELIAESEEGE